MTDDRLLDTLSTFSGLLASLLVLFVPITVGLVLLQRWLGDDRLARLLGGERLLTAVVRGTLLGAITPFCGCSTIPLLLGLLRARVRFAGVAAFMLASPLLNPYILGVVALLFGTRTMAVYAAFAAGTSMGLGALWELAGLDRELASTVRPMPLPAAVPSGLVTTATTTLGDEVPAPACEASGCSGSSEGATADRTSVAEPTWSGWRTELADAWASSIGLLRGMLRPLLLGVGIGALLYGLVPQGWLGEVLGSTTWWSLPLAAVLGLPLYLRGEAAFPIGAGLLAAGVGEGPMFAMVISGMGASLPEVTILSGIFRRRLLAAFLASVLGVAIVGGLVIPATT